MRLIQRRERLVLLLLLYALVASVLTARDGGDFDTYLEAARKLHAHQNIYAPPFVRGLQYYYSPFFALALVPFSYVPFLSEALWSFLSFLMLYRTFNLIQAYFDLSLLTPRQYNTWVLLTIVLSVQFIQYNITLIQVTPFLLWTIFESLHLIANDRSVAGGMLLGMAINIKLMPLLMLPYLIYRACFKASAVAIGTCAALLLLPLLFVGHEFNSFLLSQWWTVINPMNREQMFETGIGVHSVVAWLPVFLTSTVGEMPYTRNLLNLEAPTVEFLVNLTRVALLVSGLFFLRTLPFKKETTRLKVFWEASYVVMLIPLLFPHQQKYEFILVVPMIVYLLYFFIGTYRRARKIPYTLAFWAFVLSVLVYTPLYGSDILGDFIFALTQHFRLLTFCTLLLIPIAVYCSPTRLQAIAHEKAEKDRIGDRAHNAV